MIKQLTPRDLKTWLEQPGEKPLILDVREAWERRLCALPEAVHIPMNQIPDRLTELEAERDVVILCHHGMRSQQVALYLERLGFSRLHNLRGGIDAWAKDVDPGMAKY